jgi:thymidylate synthase
MNSLIDSKFLKRKFFSLKRNIFNNNSFNGEVDYLNILQGILENGERKSNRTGVDTLVLPTQIIQHDMALGFPLLTTKKMAKKTMMVELEGFIKGITSKKWYQDRGCRIWDGWCRPSLVPKGLSDEQRKDFQLKEDDLGPIYGAQWRNYNFQECDQLKNIINKLKTDPDDRRMVCMSWNPLVLADQALPACHLGFIIQHINGKLHLCWWQRSCDFFLGIPFNLASYSLLLHLISKEVGMGTGTVTGCLVDSHIYENHIDAVKEQLARDCNKYQLCQVKTKDVSIFDWTHEDTEFVGYESYPSIKGDVAI